MAEPPNLLEVLQTPRRNVPTFPKGSALSAEEARKATLAYEGGDGSESNASVVDDLSALVDEDERQQGEEAELRAATKSASRSETTVVKQHERIEKEAKQQADKIDDDKNKTGQQADKPEADDNMSPSDLPADGSEESLQTVTVRGGSCPVTEQLGDNNSTINTNESQEHPSSSSTSNQQGVITVEDSQASSQASQKPPMNEDTIRELQQYFDFSAEIFGDD